MKFIDADKLVEWIENNKNRLHTMEYLDPDDLLSFISTNSIDIDYSDKIKGRCKDCKHAEYCEWLASDGHGYCLEFEPKADVKTCENCGNNNSGYCPIAHTCGTIKDEPDKWTPIVNKVEEEI